MRYDGGGYLGATRHPWACVLFLLPLLGAYEAGVVLAGDGQPEALRNGADTWLRWALQTLGLSPMYGAPVVLVTVLLGWSWVRRHDRPRELLATWLGMTVESVLFAAGLWCLSRTLAPLLDGLGVQLDYPAADTAALEQIISFVGAGIYEETLFRLMLFSLLTVLFRQAEVPLAALFAGLTSSLLFAAAHNLGPHGEPFAAYVFLFRTLAGLYFALVYSLRGFGIAVGAHAGYDVLVGVLVQGDG
jgi:membrane protease YdiL (CAAX protease family)